MAYCIKLTQYTILGKLPKIVLPTQTQSTNSDGALRNGSTGA